MNTLMEASRWQWLKSLMAKDPWMGIALVQLLGPEQWEELKSGSVFNSVQASFLKASGYIARRLGRNRQEGADIADDALIKLIAGEFINGFNPELGCPCLYMQGAINNYVLGVLRLAKYRRVLPPSSGFPELIPESREFSPDYSAMLRENVEQILKMVEQLETLYRDAIYRRHPDFGTPATPFDGNAKAEYHRYWRAIQILRNRLGETDRL